MHIFVMAQDVAASVNTELDSAVQSKPSSENVNIPIVIASNNDRQDVKMENSPKDTSTSPKDLISASNKDENYTESKSVEIGTKFRAEVNINPKTEENGDTLDEAYRECKGHLSCVERKMVTLIDRLDAVKSIPILEGYVTIEKTSEEVPDRTVVQDSDVALLSRVDRYLRSHSIRAHIPDTEGDIPVFLGRVLHEKFLDFNLGTLATNDASEGQ
jgi:hypothetical protein